MLLDEMVTHYNMIPKQVEVQCSSFTATSCQRLKKPRVWPIQKESCPHVKGHVEDIIKEIRWSHTSAHLKGIDESTMEH